MRCSRGADWRVSEFTTRARIEGLVLIGLTAIDRCADMVAGDAAFFEARHIVVDLRRNAEDLDVGEVSVSKCGGYLGWGPAGK